MRLLRFASATTILGLLSLSGAGFAAADTTIDTTGPNSNQQVQIDNNLTVTTQNDNQVQVDNQNGQSAHSGNCQAQDNTVVGGLNCGAASNQSRTSTVISIQNKAKAVTVTTPGVGGVSVSGGAGGIGVSAAPGAGGVAAAPSVTPGAGAAILPVTGPLFPIDVSALRNALQKPSATATSTVVRRDQAISAAMLVIAGLMAIAGAALSSIRSRRQKVKATL